ncbi:hypothetical protein CHLRE_16g656300v5 [Chlamydomonas reinhardtii]|uniref:Dihydrodipicolinate reductase N-terminal domain-containing protein n=1 Tax=Chlamydomonas reinhardtii TaxID=3055 RepID=A8J8G6_CHLRE|nr:uncharacterized protein CHLRE_16g656300v5 [Chlamydomonas reinhardtii]PNW71487.1 hypothetical protein CHLRE_16g656300v5 [Chlamydomonas reinhardtii]|eukprot:XP_001697829.1 dihydrodipicolinate reductase [Chlamydomonas reinhardtii]
MVNSCTGKMGHAAAEALVDAGVKLVPHTFTGMSAGVAVKNIGVRGVATQLVGAEKRQAALDLIKAEYPGMMIVDYTLAHCVEDHVRLYADNGLPFVMGTMGGDRDRMRAYVEEKGVYAVLPSAAGEQAMNLFALLTSLGAPLPPHFDTYTWETVGRGDALALDLLNPQDAGEIVATLRAMGIQADDGQIYRMRASLQSRVGLNLEREPQGALHALQGRGSSRTCRITAPGAVPRLFLRHYGLSRAAFAAGAVEALRFLAARVAEGADQRVYDMVDVLRAYQGEQDKLHAVRASQQFSSNVVVAGSSVTATAATSA